MLDFSRMDSRSFMYTALVGLASLVIIPTHSARASGLRDEAASYRMQGYESQQRGDQAGALSFYQKAAALDPSYPAPYNDAGVVLEQMGRLEDAKCSYEQALAVDPNYLEAHTNLALLTEHMGKPEDAIPHWLKRYQLGNPADPWTARAEERLVALGILEPHGLIGNRRAVVDHAFDANAKSLKEFQSVTEAHGDWP